MLSDTSFSDLCLVPNSIKNEISSDWFILVIMWYFYLFRNTKYKVPLKKPWRIIDTAYCLSKVFDCDTEQYTNESVRLTQDQTGFGSFYCFVDLVCAST